jgi:trehalose synthase
MAFSPDDAAFVCHQFGIDVDRPLITQVSRFDPWKDPIGVIDAYRAVTARCPTCSWRLVGSMATDDPEGWDFFQQTVEYADGDPDIKILNNLNNVGAIEVNAFQSQSDVCLQKSIREGFGLTGHRGALEGRPTVAGNVGGIPLQIEDGEAATWRLPEECAQRCVEILADRAGSSWAKPARSTPASSSPALLRDWLHCPRARGIEQCAGGPVG